MHRHLVTPEALLADTCVLGKEEARHLQTVLRVKQGDKVELFDGQGHTRLAMISIPPHFMKCEGMEAETKASRNRLYLEYVESVMTHPKHSCALTLFACVSKGKHMDWTIEKAVELGVTRIVPVVSARTIVRIESEDRDAKKDRWMRIAEEAARQCGSAWLPEILPPCSLTESLALVKTTTPTFVAALTPDAKPLRECLAQGGQGSLLRPPGYGGQAGFRVSTFAKATADKQETASTPILPTANCQLPTVQAGWFVGPEGDFTPEELVQLQAAGAIPVSLGTNVLRTETACLYGLCVLNSAWL
jgi:16S rRNA (uracil1498-N3)-methyltransferase